MANLKSINNVKKLPFLEQILFTVLWCVLSMYVVWKKSKKYVTHIFLIQSRAGIELHLAWQLDKDKLYCPFGDKNTIPTLYLIIGLIICYHYHKMENSLTWKKMGHPWNKCFDTSTKREQMIRAHKSWGSFRQIARTKKSVHFNPMDFKNRLHETFSNSARAHNLRRKTFKPM